MSLRPLHGRHVGASEFVLEDPPGLTTLFEQGKAGLTEVAVFIGLCVLRFSPVDVLSIRMDRLRHHEGKAGGDFHMVDFKFDFELQIPL